MKKDRTLFCAFWLSFFLVVLLSSYPAVAVVLDQSFGEDGLVTTSVGHYGDSAGAVAVQTDGKIVVAGSSSNGSNDDFGLVRYTSSGELDASFNYDGRVVTAIGSYDDKASALAILDNGKIIAAGYTSNGTSNDIALVCYNSDGSLDRDFGDSGIVQLSLGNSDDAVTAVAVQPDGAIVAAGYVTGTSGRATALIRLHADGSLDYDFGDAGVTLIGLGSDAVTNGLAVQENGRIITVGTYSDNDRSAVQAMRFLADGSLDAGFGSQGVAELIDTDAETAGNGVWLLADGSFLVAGSAGLDNDRDIALFKYTSSGGVDTSFGSSGMLRKDLNGEDDAAHDVVISEDNTILVAGYTTINTLRDSVLLQYNISGDSLSLSKSTQSQSSSSIFRIGDLIIETSVEESSLLESETITLREEITTTEISLFDDASHGLALQDDTRIVAVGYSDDGGRTTFALAGYTLASSDATATATTTTSTPVIITTEISEITRTGAYTGGTIKDGSGYTFSSRGVVYSIAPYPVVKSGGSDSGGDGGDGGSGDGGSGDGGSGDGGSGDGGGSDNCSIASDTGPLRCNGQPTGTLAAGTTETYLEVNTFDSDNNPQSVECRYAPNADNLSFDTMTVFSTTNVTLHKTLITGLEDGKSYNYSVRCKDSDGNTNQLNYNIPFSVASSTTSVEQTWKGLEGPVGPVLYSMSGAVSGFFVTTAYAADSSSSSLFSTTKPEVAKEGKTEDGSGAGRFGSILTDLTPGTRYYVRAYGVTSDSEIFYGNQLTFETADACFIATAVYGSLLHPHVRQLRKFRDEYLLSNPVGTAFVNLYYHYSPPVAEIVATHPLIRLVVRMLLLPLIGLSYLSSLVGPISSAAIFVVMGSGIWFTLRQYNRRRIKGFGE